MRKWKFSPFFSAKLRCREIWREILVKFSALRFPRFGCATENFTKSSRQKRCGKRKISRKFHSAEAQRWGYVMYLAPMVPQGACGFAHARMAPEVPNCLRAWGCAEKETCCFWDSLGCGHSRLHNLAHQNRTIAIASDFRVDWAKSPEIPQKEGVLGSEIAARNRKSLATFHRTLKSQCSIAFSCLGNRAISGVRDGHRNRKSQKSLRFRRAKLHNALGLTIDALIHLTSLGSWVQFF